MRAHTALTADQHLERGRSLHRLARPGARVQGRPARDPRGCARDAERALGARSTLKAFHAVVLGAGAVTLPVLADRVNAWITQVTLDRGLGPWQAASLVVGTIIGTGMFLKTAVMAQVGGSAVWVLAAWAVAGALSLFGRADLRRARRDVSRRPAASTCSCAKATARAWASSTAGRGSGSRRRARSQRTRSARRRSSAASLPVEPGEQAGRDRARRGVHGDQLPARARPAAACRPR